MVCGETDPTVLDFHHKRGTEKLFEISSKDLNKSWEKLVKEAEKCVLICANHHRLLHRFEELGIL